MKYLLLAILLTFQCVNAQPVGYRESNPRIFEDLVMHSEKTNDLSCSSLRMKIQDITNTDDTKNVGLAVIYSLLLPGMGELYVDRYDVGKYFTLAEGALWLTWSSFQVYGNWIQNDARNYATQHADLSSTGKNDQYYIDIGNFTSIDAFNQEMLRERLPHKLYSPVSTYYWNWDTDVNREGYRQLRVSSDQVFNNSRFIIAAIAINHIVSAINAARLAIRYNSADEQTEMINIRATPIGGPLGCDGLMVSFSRTF